MPDDVEQVQPVRIALATAAQQTVHTICRQRGMTQHAVLSRLLEWFCGQPAPIQMIVLGHLPKEIEAEVAALLLRQKV